MTAAGKASRRAKGKQTPRETSELTGTPPPASASKIRVRPAVALTDTDVAKLHLETFVSMRTIERWASGFSVYRTTVLRIEKALAKLGIVKREKVTSSPPATDTSSAPARRRVVDVGSKAA